MDVSVSSLHIMTSITDFVSKFDSPYMSCLAAVGADRMAAERMAVERMALSSLATDPLIRLQMAGINPEVRPQVSCCYNLLVFHWMA